MSTESNAGLELMNCKVMTWAEVGCLMDWATQVPPWNQLLKTGIRNKLHTHYQSLPKPTFPLSSWQLLTYGFTLWICLFWAFHINELRSLLWPTYFTLYVSEVLPCCSMYQYFIPFYDNIPLYGHNTFYFIHSSVDGHLDYFHLLASMDNAVCLYKFLSVHVFISLGHISRSGMAWSYGKFNLELFQKWSTCFQEDNSILYSHQQPMKGPVAPTIHMVSLLLLSIPIGL